MAKDPIRVLVTGAAGQIAYSLLYSISKGDVFGLDQPLSLHLLDIPQMMGVLEGVVMELNDCAFPLLREIIPTADEKVAFSDIDAAFLVDQYAKKDVKVLVVGNPANTNALICSKYAPSIPRENFTAMTRLDQNRATSQIANLLKVNVSNVANIIIWGNHSSTQYPDVSHAVVNINGSVSSVPDAVKDDAYLQGDFITTVQKRGAAVIAARKLSSAMSAAKAACDHMRDWFAGTSEGKFVSMGVISDGSYGTPPDVIYSFPVTIGPDRKWKIVQGLQINDFSQTKMKVTGDELLQEREEALSVCQD
ncbi:Malate dehydrogenase like protein [Argiope bruennichi]|uniref:Malate dehydrogenase n=1 Tax=Argiope bruennichi TaxID=94029 RepID=A0A8T0EGN9_ARGBR|nr:Malate dehydrogenase like protein [Argiope bruennichi]